jgi:aryl-phospho-beta-D-glucosidase BglC (GH1 family)
MKFSLSPFVFLSHGGLSVALLLSACSSDGTQTIVEGSGGSSSSGEASGGSIATGAGGSNSGGTSNGETGGAASGGNGAGPGAGGNTVGSGGAFVGDPSTPVGMHGHLHVSGAQLVNQGGQPVQLKGISSMWLNWEDDGYALSLDALIWMRDNWNLSVIRAAMGAETDAEGSYLDAADPGAGKAEMMRQVRIIVDNAIEAGVYVIVDFHSHTSHLHEAEVADFFRQIVEIYGDVPNVLLEPFNEPTDPSDDETLEWPTLKTFFESIVATIRESDPDDNENVIILGTPRWSQDVHHAAESRLTGTNLMYTIHFYSCTHGDALLDVAKQAFLDGLPLFATEWGATEADGGVGATPVCEDEGNKWHEWMDANSISWAAWKLDDCDGFGAADTSCILNRDAPSSGGWDESHLNGHGSYVVSKLKN